MAKKRTSATDTSGKEAVSTVQYDAILDAAAKLKAAIEEKSAKALQSVLGNSPIWVANKPGSVNILANSIAALTGKATDLELSITKITGTELTDNEANISLECQLVWSNGDTWEEREASFDLHLGLTWNGSTWTFAHLAVLPAKVAPPGNLHVDAPSIDVPYFEAAAQFRSFQAAPYFENALHSASPYFSADTMASPMMRYFQDERASHLGAPQPAMFMADSGGQTAHEHKDEHHDYVPVYMPIFVPASLFKHGRK